MSASLQSPKALGNSQARFSVAANYDHDLIPALSAYPVDEIYGKLPSDGVSGGRPGYMATPVSIKELSGYVKLLDSHGISFNYLMNGSCFSNREWTRAWQKNVTALLDKITGIGIRRVTVSTPFLLELIKQRFPELHVKVGIYAQVDTARRAMFWEGLGADAITLESFSINRDFKRLASIRKAVRCDLQLIANHLCMPNCPMQVYHQNGYAHASEGSNTLFIDYCVLRCSKLRIQDPSLFIKSGWIRPEDLGEYVKMGYTTFKLLERGIPSSEILRRVKAYSERKFSGNLAGLLLSYGFKDPLKKGKLWSLRYFFKPQQANPAKMRKLFALAQRQGMLFELEECPVNIDSSKIPPGFLSGFAGRDCSSLSCDECGYCRDIADQAVSVKPGFQTEILKMYSEVDEEMASGKMWGI